MTGTAVKQKTNADYSDLLAKLQDIPTLPVVAMRVNELINDPNSSSADIAEVLKKDQVLTAKILRLVNSGYYSIPGGVADVQRALAFLGFNTLAQLTLSLSVFSVFKKAAKDEFSMPEFWKHALGTAVCSEMLSRKLKIAKPEEAFTCGLLHDVGKLVLNEVDPERLATIVRETTSRSCTFIEVEKERDLPGHTYLGEVIAKKWGLPQLIQLTIRYHHQDVSQVATLLASEKPVIQLVRLANTICVKNRIGASGDCSEGKITNDMLVPLKLFPADIPKIEADLQKEMEKAGAFLNAYR
ncbi:MAG TPA: HDOD domain-containing protein [Bdellovibrionota bacterium]|jgi:putative nucleotidyltransferase with HDIG domain|nr:HDOD domain-containing protein [Bdellovibrionota bacterium]